MTAAGDAVDVEAVVAPAAYKRRFLQTRRPLNANPYFLGPTASLHLLSFIFVCSFFKSPLFLFYSEPRLERDTERAEREGRERHSVMAAARAGRQCFSSTSQLIQTLTSIKTDEQLFIV